MQKNHIQCFGAIFYSHMLNDATCFKKIFIVTGYTDLRSGIDRLADGVYMAGTLGVAWAAFFPYLFLLYLTPIFSIIYGFTGISIKHVSGEEVAE